MSIIEMLKEENVWNDFMKYKIDGGHLPKRIVFLFNENENYVLKAIMFLLYKYDNLFTQNLYSFRQNISVKTAIHDITKKDIKTMYGYKADIHDYFNSVDVEIMKSILKSKIKDGYHILRKKE